MFVETYQGFLMSETCLVRHIRDLPYLKHRSLIFMETEAVTETLDSCSVLLWFIV